ncbi:TonB-dependent receptor plug domain-containing protein [Flavobacterium sp. TAB 87]|uniref:TonB-dependent receptor n=1 Tax=Flavobacterium sp. TAB 87 TaxID=1729581 RepID=UPI00076D666F|nr:TonB-dependent receptor plug domain-containing protein [Flavobacterium sp. TAB 87]KVV15393.1 TonB-dependent Receptor Plug Domain protein [Flavobacterium sp. TAB 87]
MNTLKIALVFLITGIGISVEAQNAFLRGVVLDEKHQTVASVNILCLGKQAQSQADGSFSIELPSNKKVSVIFTHVALKMITLDLLLNTNEYFVFNPVMKERIEQIGEVVVSQTNSKRVDGILSLSASIVQKIPGANEGIENVLKSLPGVNSNNELSTQYAVRGGNYDENLVYVNEIEMYRPFLIRSGQQEGLSFNNTDLVQNVDFSAGGFQAKYGDKVSSVLDITYRKPTQFAAYLQASFLGGSLGFDFISKSKKWTGVTGVRYRNNSLLVNSQDTQTNYTPSFVDVQTNINFQSSDVWELSFLGAISQNNYEYEPLTRQTKFGTIAQPLTLSVFYQGLEKDIYNTYFGAVKSTHKISDATTLKVIASLYHTTEQEHFDILGQYLLKPTNAVVGDVDYETGIGSQLNHARNDLDALIASLEIKGNNNWNDNSVAWGAKFTSESIRDRLVEWEVIDSAGFSINPPILNLPINEQPYATYTGPLLPYQNVRANNSNQINRFSGFVQFNRKSEVGSSQIWYNAGVRFQDWQVLGGAVRGGNQIVFSPRAQFALRPNWTANMIFRLSGGLYYQPPFYRELRDNQGVVQPNVEAQQSVQIVLGNDYNFKMWQRPFKLVSELYYKWLDDVNVYSIDNVRIRYAANNTAVAYAKGIDLRLNGEFVPGTESWLSFGYLKTEENYQNKGYIARPTDQRLKFAMLFQDYMPNLPSVKLYLNLVYNTGLPGGSPSYSDSYLYQNRLKDYRRADIGFSKVFIDVNTIQAKQNWLSNFKELSIGLEIFNLFNNQNAITNTWVRDVYSKNEYAIPNYMTSRVFNVKMHMRL